MHLFVLLIDAIIMDLKVEKVIYIYFKFKKII